MNDDREYKGKIYIPQTQTEYEVILIPDEYVLHGIPDFVDVEEWEKQSWAMLYGEFEELGPVTFLDVLPRIYLNNVGLFSYAIQFMKMFSGVHLPSHDNKFISSVTFSSKALSDWISEDLQSMRNLLVVDITLPSQTIHVNYSFEHTTENQLLTKIQLDFNDPLTVYELGYLRNKWQKLILFLTNEDPEINLLSYNGSHALRIYDMVDFDRDWFSDAIEIPFSQIKNELNAFVKRWFENRKLDNIRTLLLERKYNHDLSKERYFLNMCIALESFHRRFVNDTVPLSDNTSVENRELIKSHLQENPELLKWFNSKSAFWKSPTLYDRLIDLKDEYSEIVRDLFSLPIEDLIRNVKKCRDRLAHDGEYEMIFQEEIELFLVGYSLEMLLFVLLHKEHGIKSEALLNKIQDRAHWNLERLCKLNTHHSPSFSVLKFQDPLC